jgi:hypothetical protein
MPKKASKALNKSEFVRSMPEGLSAAEIVAKAKAAGMSLTAGHVYTIRAAAKRKEGIPARGRRSAGRNGVASNGSNSAERQFITLALDLGLSQAEALLTRIKTNLGAL